ncbi:hypothetical protein BVC80_1835g499 [Macleaya cordata]|uniref:Uncharacterized protein n=1 Tax=Macleaya cordata TaxID=56857 RepID=A0A200R5X3_MACCD|nr:hypothetical protein BVC80_1835g499 [Macleaya cordata]
MAKHFRLWFCLISVLLVSDFAISADPPPTISPNLAPESLADDSSISSPPSISDSPAFAPGIQIHQNGISSPPAPSPLHSGPGSSPTHSPIPSPSDASDVNSPAPSPFDASDINSPVPSPSDASDINHVSDDAGIEKSEGSSGGMSGIKKVGITIGVVVGAGLVGIGGFVYKKRQENIRRSRYAYAAGGDFL